MCLVAPDVALRLKEVTEVESPHVPAAFMTRAFELKKLKEPDIPAVDLSGTGPLVMSVGRFFPIVTLSRELTDPRWATLVSLPDLSR